MRLDSSKPASEWRDAFAGPAITVFPRALSRAEKRIVARYFAARYVSSRRKRRRVEVRFALEDRRVRRLHRGTGQ